jgi:hypothetical protein
MDAVARLFGVEPGSAPVPNRAVTPHARTQAQAKAS